MSVWIETTLGEACELYQPQTISSAELVEDGSYPVYGANGIIGRYDKFNHEESQLLVTCRGATCGTVNITQPYAWQSQQSSAPPLSGKVAAWESTTNN